MFSFSLHSFSFIFTFYGDFYLPTFADFIICFTLNSPLPSQIPAWHSFGGLCFRPFQVNPAFSRYRFCLKHLPSLFCAESRFNDGKPLKRKISIQFVEPEIAALESRRSSCDVRDGLNLVFLVFYFRTFRSFPGSGGGRRAADDR